MSHNTEHIDDFEYLAKQGFEKVSVKEADIKQLQKTIKNNVSFFNKGFYIASISLIIGVFIGAAIFFSVTHTVTSNSNHASKDALNNSFKNDTAVKNMIVNLDTITVLNDNFENPKINRQQSVSKQSEITAKQPIDSVIEIPAKAMEISRLLQKPIKEEKLKFIINASVFYLHDLKVTNYTTLYFKKNQFVPFNGLSADYASKGNFNQTPSHLKQSADYFLHEELANALLSFKKGNYDKCIQSLNTVATYNADDLNCSFYLGMCYYYKINYAKAISLFDKCLENVNNTFLQESNYYKALSLLENGNKTEATKLLNEIKDDGEFYAEKASAFLKSK